MSVPVLSAARTLCEIRDWKVSNLELQKILYIAQMFHLGKTGGQPLIHEAFEAWEYGPVVPELYRRARGFGSGPVRNVFHWEAPVVKGSPEYQTLLEASETTKGMSPGRLVAITHWPLGAWHKSYRHGTRSMPIPNDQILQEYRDRAKS